MGFRNHTYHPFLPKCILTDSFVIPSSFSFHTGKQKRSLKKTRFNRSSENLIRNPTFNELRWLNRSELTI